MTEGQWKSSDKLTLKLAKDSPKKRFISGG
jgi:hypothetical protein